MFFIHGYSNRCLKVAKSFCFCYKNLVTNADYFRLHINAIDLTIS